MVKLFSLCNAVTLLVVSLLGSRQGVNALSGARALDAEDLQEVLDLGTPLVSIPTTKCVCVLHTIQYKL
jgi:hypothetical protein